MKVANFSQFPQCVRWQCESPAGSYDSVRIPYCCRHHPTIRCDRPIWSGPVFGTLPAAASTPRMVPR